LETIRHDPDRVHQAELMVDVSVTMANFGSSDEAAKQLRISGNT
jgi:hypothetical protein